MVEMAIVIADPKAVTLAAVVVGDGAGSVVVDYFVPTVYHSVAGERSQDCPTFALSSLMSAVLTANWRATMRFGAA